MATIISKRETQVKNLESLISLINCASTNIGKQTFYNTEDAQRGTLVKIHDEALQTSRTFYSLMLLPDFITDANRKVAVSNLLKHTDVPVEQKAWENALIMQAFSTMQPNRVFDVLNHAVDNKINNARTRGLMKAYLNANRRSLSLWALKYRKPFKRIVRHAHIPSKYYDAIKFIVGAKGFEQDKLLTDYVTASKDGNLDALCKLPLTIARGLAAKHKIKEADFLKQFNATGTLTQKEKRQQFTELKNKGVKVDLDLTNLDLFDLYVFLGNQHDKGDLPMNAKTLIKNAAKKAAEGIPYHFEDVGVIVDTSLSMSGMQESKNHPLYRSLAIASILSEISDKSTIYYTNGDKALIPTLTAQSNYSVPLLQALKAGHKYIFILGDGYENSPYEGASNQLLTVYKNKIDKKNKTVIIQFNPVFASEAKTVRGLFNKEYCEAVGIRNTKSFVPALFLSISKYDKLSALKAYMLELLRLQNPVVRALQPKDVQLALE